MSALPKLVHAYTRNILVSPSQTRRGIELLPHQLVASKMVFFLDLFFNLYIDNLFAKPVDPGVPPQYTLRQDRIAGTTSSWRAWAEAREVDEWIHSVAGVLDQGWNDQ